MSWQSKCGHIPCSCDAREGEAYCSTECARHADGGEVRPCRCGHATCSGAELDPKRSVAGAEDESTDSDADNSMGPGDPTQRGGTQGS